MNYIWDQYAGHVGFADPTSSFADHVDFTARTTDSVFPDLAVALQGEPDNDGLATTVDEETASVNVGNGIQVVAGNLGTVQNEDPNFCCCSSCRAQEVANAVLVNTDPEQEEEAAETGSRQQSLQRSLEAVMSSTNPMPAGPTYTRQSSVICSNEADVVVATFPTMYGLDFENDGRQFFFSNAVRLSAMKARRMLIPCERPYCTYATSRRNNLTRHMKATHADVRLEKSLVCCDLAFSEAGLFCLHGKLAHSGGYFCRGGEAIDKDRDCCRAWFARKALLERHELTHRVVDSVFRCDQGQGCHYSSHHRSNIERHVKSHLRRGAEEHSGLKERSSGREEYAAKRRAAEMARRIARKASDSIKKQLQRASEKAERAKRVSERKAEQLEVAARKRAEKKKMRMATLLPDNHSWFVVNTKEPEGVLPQPSELAELQDYCDNYSIKAELDPDTIIPTFGLEVMNEIEISDDNNCAIEYGNVYVFGDYKL